MNQIPPCDCLPEWARWSYLARSGFLAWSCKIKDHFLVFYPIIINPLLTKLVPSRWLDISPVFFFFCVFMNLDFVSVHKHTKKELGQYPAILTSHLVNNPYVLPVFSQACLSHASQPVIKINGLTWGQFLKVVITLFQGVE